MRLLAGGIFAVAVTIWVAWITLREPRFNGRTATEWLDLMGEPHQVRSGPGVRSHPTRQAMEGMAPGFLTALERDFRRTALGLIRSRERFRKKVHLWASVTRVVPNGLGLASPERDVETEIRAGRRLYWCTSLLMDLSPDPAKALSRFEAIADRYKVPTQSLLEASNGFREIDDPEGVLVGDLIRRVEASGKDPDRRAVWIACLGHLGVQAASAADLVRSFTRDPNSEVRRQSIVALGRIDLREDVVAFVQGCATDLLGRQAAMGAFLSMGERARPAEVFIRDALDDRDVATSFFAKLALETMATGSGSAIRTIDSPPK